MKRQNFLARIVEYRNLVSKDLFLKRVIDFDCGFGILSIAMVKLGFKAIYGFDIDPDAIRINEKCDRKWYFGH
jgi:ribosomal protein L11 methylase PrmA